ncbi:hypothetical protein Tco_0802477 [Tanacetum coccineum]|uniref:BZIP domain-containing protein n=1 Tax=Tanacetum coccineum TaxID=301880 RepID=A0ABQ4ZYX0_9ASTR
MDLLPLSKCALTKVQIGERQRAEGEPKLLDTTVGRVVLLLPVAPARASSELEASVDKLFYEGGSDSHAEQGDSVSGGHGVGVLQVSETAEIVAEDATPKLREDYETSTGPSVAGKSRSALQRLLARVVLNLEVWIVALPTLPFITSSVSVTPERESEDQTDSMAGANLQTITAPPRFVISSDSSHHSGANIAEAEVDSFARPFIPLMTVATTITSIVDPATTVKKNLLSLLFFCGDSSGGGADHTVGGFSDLTGSDFIVGGIRTVISPNVDLQKVYVPQWSVTNGSRLDDGRTARQMSLSAEVMVRAEYNIRERERRRRLNSVMEKKNSLLKDEKMAEVNEKFDKLCANFVEMALHLEETFYPHLLTTISGRRWLLTHDMELAIAKCLNSTEYLSVLGAAIDKAV